MEKVEEEEWPDVIGEKEDERHASYAGICKAVGDLTAAILEAKVAGVLTTTVAESIHGFLGGVQDSLEEHME